MMSKERKLPKPKWLGEMCPKCGKYRMLHPNLYFYRCIGCGYEYTIDPVLGTVDEKFRGGLDND